ncbi:hypothetical protein BDP27DRAFT_1265102 [Rhodocollybia butyracea]|uniref:DUF6535 domain-containing protein n=1 Tax=Rhodocollybia butyracea TaxID=206335 RepID=A0A9P5PWI4_9AGAR|nr:hypothetical protein BDP27DRAFT_1265102 [Rhodocollybia butyracea]
MPVPEPTSTGQAGAHAAAPDGSNNALPAQESDPPAGTLTSILSPLSETVLDLQHAVTGSEKKAEQGTKSGPFKARRFGLKKDQAAYDPLVASYDYTLKYPEDERYHELGEEARVWKVYGDEATAFDNDMIGELSDSLDILLVFAGLFSAVLTTFVAQTSQSLSQDSTQLSVSYLSELTMLVRANTNSTAISNTPPTSTAFSPAIPDLWVNGLWFTGLAISLSVALFAVLAKQWLRQYVSIITGTPRERALIRQFRFDGLEKWRVQSLIGMLPTLLHLALILFLAGLVIFLIPLSTTMAYIVGAISVTVVALYLMATVLPLFTIQCSYRTTLTHLLFSRVLYRLFWGVCTITISAYNWVRKGPLDSEFPRYPMPYMNRTLKAGERLMACQRRQNHYLVALAWLGHYTSNRSAKSVLSRSLGAISPGLSLEKPMKEVMNQVPVFSQIKEYICASTNLDELEGWFRAGIHFSSVMPGGLHSYKQAFNRSYKDNISDHNCDITSALSALAFGLSPVKFFHAGQYIELAAENTINWVLDTYKEGPPLNLPPLVWEPLLQRSGYNVGRLPEYLRRHYSDYTVSSIQIQDIIEPAHVPSVRRSRTPLPNS